MATPTPTFGRRRTAHAEPPIPTVQELSERDRALYRSIAVGTPGSRSEEENASRVPNSAGAGILTGAVVGVAQLAIHMHESMTDGLHLGPITVDLGRSTLPVTLSLTLWAGGRAGFIAAFVVHGVLRRLHRTTFLAYAVTGALAGLTLAMLLQFFGNSQGDWLIETALGAAAGALYRLFAGARPAA